MRRHRSQRFSLRTAAVYAAGIVCLAGWTEADADDWGAVVPPEGLAAGCWNRLVGHFREKSYTVVEMQPCLDLLVAALQEGLPADVVVTRLEEGVVKHADAAMLKATVRCRVEALRAAGALVKDAGYPPWTTPPMQGLLAAVASAIESDVPIAGLRQALKLGGGRGAMRTKFVVEAGESLKLMGLDGGTICLLMEDFVARDLGCGEIVRATQFVGQQRRLGVSGTHIREMLWNERGAGPQLR